MSGLCVGPEFGYDDRTGALILDGIGDPKAWPYPCTMSANNGLNLESGKGLWTAPHGVYRWRNEQRAQLAAGGVVLTGSQNYDAPYQTFTITNPSSVSQLVIWRFFSTWVWVDLAGLGVALHQHILTRDSLPTPAQIVTVGTQWNPGGDNGGSGGLPAGSVFPWYDQRSDQSHNSHGAGGLLDPGGTVTFYPFLRVLSSSGAGGTATVRDWSITLDIFGMLMDPTQAGDKT